MAARGRHLTAAARRRELSHPVRIVVAGWTDDGEARLEYDHDLPFAAGGPTEAGNLNRACSAHLDLKTFHGWDLVAGVGRRAMVPPDDPRHPRHKPPPG